MARGWESKSVEEQIAVAEAEKQARERSELTAAERERQANRARLLLVRARIVHDLEAASHERHRTQLKQALAEIDAQIGATDGPGQVP